MLVQKKVSIMGEWIKKEDLENGDIIKVLDAGELMPGDYGERHVFKIETKNGERLITFNQSSMNYLIDAFGEETEKWIGKKVKAWIVKMSVAGKIKPVIFLTAPDWTEGDDGYFHSPSDNIPVIEEN